MVQFLWGVNDMPPFPRLQVRQKYFCINNNISINTLLNETVRNTCADF
ncbi:hypothetical protein JOE09_003286 [Pantoea coffeiphila]|nr:hypothetical protein [Pantoea coffeiphila]